MGQNTFLQNQRNLARLKGTDFIVDVTPYYSNGQLIGYQDRNAPPGVLIYSPEQLDFIPEPDWETYRREVAKAVLAGMVVNVRDRYKYQQIVTDAIDYADELIRQLKEEE